MNKIIQDNETKNQNQSSSVLGSHLWKLLPFLAPYKKRILFGLVTNGLARFFDLLPLVIVGRVVDRITLSMDQGQSMEATPFILFGLVVLLTFVGLSLFQSFSNYALGTMAQMVRHDLRVSLYRKLQLMDISYFENRQTGDIMSVISNDVDNLENFLADATTSMVRLVITFLGIFGFLIWLDYHLALLLFIPMPFAILAVRFFATKVQPQYRRARKAVGAVNSILENNIQGMDVIQAYTAEEDQVQRVREQSEEYRDAAIAAARERARFVPLLYIIAGTAFAGLIAGGGWMTMTGIGPSLGDYTTFILMSLRLILPLFVFGMLINQIQRTEASAQRIMELIALEPDITDHPDARPLQQTPEKIEFNDVHFAYVSREKVINGISFTLHHGQVLGVVGPTGAGKSTLVKLLLRYYEPSSGSITINDQALNEIELESFRRNIGYVSQEAFLFYGTVSENIRLGSPHASEDQVREAAEIAGAEEFITDLPQGYETLVGERGIKLSGGQRQRISLARAVLRDPAILILDEATSAVDTRTEEIIQKNLHHFRQNRMTLAVAHRLSTIRHSDEILVIVDGLIVERGTHDSLQEAGGVYAGLWAVQSGDSEKVMNDKA